VAINTQPSARITVKLILKAMIKLEGQGETAPKFVRRIEAAIDPGINFKTTQTPTGYVITLIIRGRINNDINDGAHRVTTPL